MIFNNCYRSRALHAQYHVATTYATVNCASTKSYVSL